VFRIRFMPSAPGDYSYSVTYQQGEFRKEHSGSFRAVNGNRRGVLRVDPDYPFHFIWEGTGEHYFFNGTTAFFMMGWRDDAVINGIIARLSRLKINRIRPMLAARTSQFWGEPIVPSQDFQICLNPWVAERPENVTNPGFDYARSTGPPRCRRTSRERVTEPVRRRRFVEFGCQLKHLADFPAPHVGDGFELV
jgi:hypothetical protein